MSMLPRWPESRVKVHHEQYKEANTKRSPESDQTRPDGRDDGMGDLIARRRYRVPEGKEEIHMPR
jgi:hypothetical protein